MSGPAQPTITVIIPCLNRPDLLEAVLRCVRAQRHTVAEILVIDDGSSEDLSSVAAVAGARVIRLPGTQGFAAAVNRGFAEARSEWLAVLNNDVQIPPTWLSMLLAGAESDHSAFACGKLLDASDPERIDGTFDLLCRGGTAWQCGNGRMDGPQWSQPQVIQFPSFTAILIRRSTLDAVGGLDERYGSYLEDLDWGAKCAAFGLRGIYVPAAVGLHAGSATLGAWRSATVRMISRNQILFYLKNLRGAGLFRTVVAQLLWMTLAARHGKLWSAVEGKCAGLCRVREWTRQESWWPRIRESVEESEASLLSFQKRSGFDTYWHLYFRLTGTRTCNGSPPSSSPTTRNR